MRITAMAGLLALGLSSAAASETSELLELELSLGRTQLPIVILEAESRAGPLDVAVFWSVNGLPAPEGPTFLQGEQLLELHAFPLREASIVCAAVVPAAEAPSLEDLQAHCADRLAAFKKPRRLVLVDQLPRTDATGQVQRPLLVERLLAMPIG